MQGLALLFLVTALGGLVSSARGEPGAGASSSAPVGSSSSSSAANASPVLLLPPELAAPVLGRLVRSRGYTEMERLIRVGRVDINTPLEGVDVSLLHRAIDDRHYEWALKLVELGATLSKSDLIFLLRNQSDWDRPGEGHYWALLERWLELAPDQDWTSLLPYVQRESMYDTLISRGAVLTPEIFEAALAQPRENAILLKKAPLEFLQENANRFAAAALKKEKFSVAETFLGLPGADLREVNRLLAESIDGVVVELVHDGRFALSLRLLELNENPAALALRTRGPYGADDNLLMTAVRASSRKYSETRGDYFALIDYLIGLGCPLDGTAVSALVRNDWDLLRHLIARGAPVSRKTVREAVTHNSPPEVLADLFSHYRPSRAECLRLAQLALRENKLQAFLFLVKREGVPVDLLYRTETYHREGFFLLPGTALSRAAQAQDYAAIVELLDLGADPSISLRKGHSVLLSILSGAPREGADSLSPDQRSELLGRLLDDPGVDFDYGLDLALRHADFVSATTLLDRGAPVHESTLRLAAESDAPPALLDKLIQARNRAAGAGAPIARPEAASPFTLRCRDTLLKSRYRWLGW